MKVKLLLSSASVYEETWRRFRRGRWLVVSAALVWLMWLLVESRLDPHFEVTRQLAISFAICAIFWSYAVLRYLWSRCPRCGHPFQSGFIMGPWTIIPRKECIHCGLPFGADANS